MPAKALPASERALVFDRAEGSCDRCGIPITSESGHYHHRKLRSRGGEHSYANGVALCPPCHQWAHQNVGAATRTGWIVASGSDPADEPVLTLWNALLLPGRTRWLNINERSES